MKSMPVVALSIGATAAVARQRGTPLNDPF